MNVNLSRLISSAVAIVLAMSSSAFAQSNARGSNNCSPPCPEPKQGCPCPPFEKTCPCPAGVCPCPPYEQGEPLTNCVRFPPAYNAPAAVDVQCSWDVFLSGSFIYWLTSEEGLEMGYNTAAEAATVTANPLILPPNNGRVQTPDFGYEPGFKVGIGMNFDHDNWVGFLEYTWLHFTKNTSVSVPTDNRGTGIVLTNNWFVFKDANTEFLANSCATSVSSGWNVKFDMLDATLSRPYYLGRSLTVSPYAGARTVWLSQNFNVLENAINLESGQTVSLRSRNRSSSWSIGPVAGALGHWLLCSGLRAEADVNASIGYTTYTKVIHREDSEGLQNAVVASTPSIALGNPNYGVLRPMTSMGLGFGWGTYLDRQSYHLDISANYDFTILWSQNMSRQLVDLLNAGVSAQPGNLYMSGLTVSMRLDF